MKQAQAVESFLAGRRVVIAKFVAHRYKEVSNKAKKVVGIVNLYEVQCADGKAPTVQMWCPRSVQTVEQAAKECPCQFKDGQKIVVEFDLMEPNTFDAKNGVIIRAGSVLPWELFVLWSRLAPPREGIAGGCARSARRLQSILVREVCPDAEK